MSAFIIAIDGYASCGKSVLARHIADKFNYVYIDSGAIYRSITWFLANASISFDEEFSIINALPKISIRFIRKGKSQLIYCNEDDVTDLIRTQAVSELVSYYARNLDIREFATHLQQDYQYTEQGIVMDGRDIGTAVFPNAQVKFFVISDIELRTQRRYAELSKKPNNFVTIKQVRQNLLERDAMDSSREHSPLRQAEDAIVLKNTNLTMEELVNQAIYIINNIAAKHNFKN